MSFLLKTLKCLQLGSIFCFLGFTILFYESSLDEEKSHNSKFVFKFWPIQY